MKGLKTWFPYILTPLLSLIIFAVFFQLWKVDFSRIFFDYSGDALLAAFGVKNVIDSGWFFSNEIVGWPHVNGIFYFHDFPAHADFFNFLIFKIFTYFSSNPFFILNGFFLLTFILITLTSFAVLRSFGISNFSACLTSILYAFTHYHFQRQIHHLFLSNYMIVPLSVMIALWISEQKIRLINLSEKECFYFHPNSFFAVAFLVCCFAAGSGIYYAAYSCIVFIFAWFLCGLENGKFFGRSFFAVIALCLTIIFIVVLLHIPSFEYWANNGWNRFVANRDQHESEFYGLKTVSLLLPVENHYLQYFSDIRRAFNVFTYESESRAENLGILASAAFLFLLIWMLAKSFMHKKNSFLQRTIEKLSLRDDEQNRITRLAGLNFLILIFASCGGLIMLISVTMPLLRSHARFSIFIAFLATFLLAIIFDKIIKSFAARRKFLVHFILLAICILALFDQVGRVSALTLQSEENMKLFSSNENFVKKIEESLPQGSLIFALPLVDFPESGSYDMMYGYLHSKNLRWSYPAMKGRESALWQEKIFRMDFKNFISELKKAGFNGVYIDRNLAVERFGWPKLRQLETSLKSISTASPITSQNLRMVFFKI